MLLHFYLFQLYEARHLILFKALSCFYCKREHTKIISLYRKFAAGINIFG